MHRTIIPYLWGFLLTACVAGDKWLPDTRPLLPSQAEVQAYIRLHWDDWEWHSVFAKMADRKGEAVTLDSLGPVACKYLYLTPTCTVEVTGKFASGERKTLLMYPQFERDKSGHLVEVIVSYHKVHRQQQLGVKSEH